jgi:hypothetical protein
LLEQSADEVSPAAAMTIGVLFGPLRGSRKTITKSLGGVEQFGPKRHDGEERSQDDSNDSALAPPRGDRHRPTREKPPPIDPGIRGP